MKTLGLTGGIGSGKSTVAQLFKEQGALIVDADEIARHVRRPDGPAHAEILKRFQTTERQALRQIITASPGAKRDLENILHPLIKLESDAQIKEAITANPMAPCLVYEATLLIEADRADDFDALLVVTSPLPERLKRIASRDQISEKDAVSLIQAQNDDLFRTKRATFVIENLGTIEHLREQVRKVLDQIIST
jgi:dephospho-CoA kinase